MRCLLRFIGSVRVAAGALALAAVLGLLLPAPTGAQQARPVQLPADARFGELKGLAYPLARIGKDTLRLAPGARIYNTQNLIVMPASVTGTGPVLYELDFQGEVAQLWLLTPEEAAAAKKRSSARKP